MIFRTACCSWTGQHDHYTALLLGIPIIKLFVCFLSFSFFLCEAFTGNRVRKISKPRRENATCQRVEKITHLEKYHREDKKSSSPSDCCSTVTLMLEEKRGRLFEDKRTSSTELHCCEFFVCILLFWSIKLE